LILLHEFAADKALTVKGRAARQFFEDNLVVVLKPEIRTVEVAAKVLMVSQLGVIQGTVKFAFASS
jgi:hypothetical protein